jgi:outer membrane protein assembly factor BamB
MIKVVLSTILIGLAVARVCQAADTIDGFPKLSASRDWPWWRGPQRNGYAHENSKPPKTWSETENIVFKTPLPGRSHASPTIVGEQIFLATADEPSQTQSVLALDRNSGKLLWKSDLSQGGFPKTHSKNTHATPTIACDGDLLFATFHHHNQLQVVALTRAGKIAWDKSLGEFHPKVFEYGYAPSPVLYQNTVIIAAEFDGVSYITALNRMNGEPVWRTPRANMITFSTPSINVIGQRDLLTLSGAGKVSCYDPATGKPLWSVDGTTLATCGTTVWDGDIVFASGGYPKAETLAVRVGNAGEVLWRNNQKCYEQSMLAHQGHLYALTDNGIAFCFRGTDGQVMWQKRLQGPVSASPILANGRIYWANERGTMYVFQANPKSFELISENRLGDESFASPAVSGDQLFLRVASSSTGKRQEFLYCIGPAERTQ